MTVDFPLKEGVGLNFSVTYPLLILADRVRSIMALVVPVTDEFGEISAEVERCETAPDVLDVPERTFIGGLLCKEPTPFRNLPIPTQIQCLKAKDLDHTMRFYLHIWRKLIRN